MDASTAPPPAGRWSTFNPQATLCKSTFGTTESKSIVPLTPENPQPRLNLAHGLDSKEPSSSLEQGQNSGMRHGPNFGSQLQEPVYMIKWSKSPDAAELEDPENIEVELLSSLALDRQVESNILPFIVHCFASSITRFAFEPSRVVPLLRDYISRGYSLGDEGRQTLLLISNICLEVSESTNYDLTDFITLKRQVVNRVVDARGRDDADLTRQLAVEAMFISLSWIVGSLANFLNVMSLYAPVFRRACPEPSDRLVNLPRRLTAMEFNLKYYATLDVLQSFITHRPMFFRYDLDFPSPHDEMLMKLGDRPGVGWLYGTPDRLVVALARMNTLFEEFGSRLNPETMQELETEIEDCTSIVSTGTGPALNIERTIVRESWKMAASLYLYMGLCGANSSDARVVKIQKRFMRLLRGIKPHRNPDSFLVLPIFALGIATTSSTGRSTIITRLWGVSECSRPGTVKNDLVRILNDIWAYAKGKPTVWADLRTACVRVTGM